MSNSEIIDIAGTFRTEAFSTVKEWLARDELTAKQEERTKTALDKILAIFQIVQKQEQAKWKRNYSGRILFSSKGRYNISTQDRAARQSEVN